MKQIFKYLAEHKGAVVMIILLLVVQAYCDLSLPSYTSDIVDVGIEQGGIEHVYGKSITDPCIGWATTERLIYDLAEMNQI